MKKREIEYIPPELMQRLQSQLPIKEAVRTSVLSKSWLHAWSTIPALSFNVGTIGRVNQMQLLKLVDVERTVARYLCDNMPIETFRLKIDIKNQESASHAQQLIGPVASKTSLKEISLMIFALGASFTLPDEILASENLTDIKVSARMPNVHSVFWKTTTMTPKCVSSLRELELDGVCISEEALHEILSSCCLLERIQLLYCCKGFKTIKVKDIPRLYKLKVSLREDYGCGHSTALELSGVPELVEFSYKLDVWGQHMLVIPFSAASHYSISLGGRSEMRQLTLGGVITDNACLDKINSGLFPFLKSLTLGMESWKLGVFHFSSCPASVKRLTLKSCPSTLIDVQVYAPKLLEFEFHGDTLPNFLFPVSPLLNQTKVSLSLNNHPVDADFFIRMREALALSRMCNLRILTDNSYPTLPLDIDELRTRLLAVFPHPAKNVQEVWFKTMRDDCVWERSPFFDAFFEICHPKRVVAPPDGYFPHNNHFCRLMLREVLDLEKNNNTTTNNNATATYRWPHYLKHVQIRRWATLYQNKWETLTDSHRSLLDGSAPGAADRVPMEFNLNWL